MLSLQRLQFEYLRQEGYVNLRCNGAVGCPEMLRPFREQENQAILRKNLTMTEEVEMAMPEVWQEFFGPDRSKEGNNTQWRDMPQSIGAPCCAQFAATREEIRKSPKRDYERYKQWLMDTELEDRISGRVFEFLWHIIFGKDNVQ